MSQSDSNFNYEGTTGISSLISKLCNYYANNDKTKSENYYKIAISSLSQTDFNRTSDEQYVVTNIRKYLQQKSPEKVYEFDKLYIKLQKSTVLLQKCAILQFLLSLASSENRASGSNNANVFTMLKKPQENTVLTSRSNIYQTFLSQDSRSSVKKLYTASKTSARSSRSQMSTNSTNGQWIPENELNLYSGASSALSICPSIPEEQLLHDIIYSFQGIEGQILKREPGGLGFIIDIKKGKGLEPLKRSVIERLSHMGYLHNKIKQHCDEADKHIGLIGQSLIAIFRDKLTEYYQLLAVLQSSLKRDSRYDHAELTLRRCLVWIGEPQLKLQWYAYIIEQCINKKGGALISEVNGFLLHGASVVQQIAGDILAAVCKPLYMMLLKWLLDGQLNDPAGEFFIEARSISTDERLWHDKYHVRKTMIPSFISYEQANKILASGKSINFLRQICKDSEGLPGRESLQKLFMQTTADALYIFDKSITLHTTLDRVYRETSLRVVDLLKGKYRLLEHLQALRRYLLLGQGDFIRHLLELLAPELCKPAQDLIGHTLSGILESAIRVTNAQYEDEDTLKRINVVMKSHSHGDTGWDVFNLMYVVDGPVGTIFQPTMYTYRGLFGVLWMAKRMEFVLSNMRKQQITSAKLFRKMSELKPVTHSIHVLTCEMIHFLHQTQYYFLFEVLECSWAEMLQKVNQAENLDSVIDAHTKFLNSVQNGVLLTTASAELHSQLRIIYNLILNFEAIQESLFHLIYKEKEAAANFTKICEQKKGFALTTKDEVSNRERQSKFRHSLELTNRQVKQLATNFRQFILKYLGLLAASPDLNLQLLSVRLNFNDYYNNII